MIGWANAEDQRIGWANAGRQMIRWEDHAEVRLGVWIVKKPLSENLYLNLVSRDSAQFD
jgi:hypothetical protein